MSAMRTDTADYAAAGPGSRIRDWFGAVWADKARLRRILMYWGVGLVAAIALALYLTGGRYVTTDDSYVRAAKLMVSTDVSGLVDSVNVHEGQSVRKGDILFKLDPRPFQIVRDTASANLAQAVQNVESTRSQYRSILAQIASQQAQATLAGQTYARYVALQRQNAIAGTQVDQARGALLSAQAMVASLQQQARQALAQLGGNPDMPAVQTPAYRSAQAALAEAQRQLDHTVVRAPFDGVVGEVDSLQPGTLVISAMSAFTTTSAVGLVASKDLWIDAAMKETDLTYVRSGNPVDITIDTYPSCSWTGKVDAVSAASDSAFSALPAENGSGNWVKVVQRIPTRIKIVSSSCPNVTLSAGMSASVSIDTGKRRWSRMLGR
ncbi:MAG TPA: HlyD family secretion protein [Rhizomicrobium sp.]|jgi:membrane fusion protein (multidrug efflux system)|nr:HlyD family secretion protein [Rhizomicrobium sp.]